MHGGGRLVTIAMVYDRGHNVHLEGRVNEFPEGDIR
jgi:hypothetical protein